MKSYEIVTDENENIGIKCLLCNMTSWHPMDAERKFCGNCKLFHLDLGGQIPAHGIFQRYTGGDGD